MTIDEVIAKYKEITNTDSSCPRYCMLPCDECVQGCGQVLEWLEELKVYHQHEVICNKGYNAGYNKAIDDFIHECDKHCGFYTGYNENLTREDILRIAEQLKAGDRE